MKPQVILFDVNETLLDLQALRPLFAEIFGDPQITGQWFVQLLRSAMVATIIGDYHDFAEIGRDALDMTARRRGLSLTSVDRDRILHAMRRLPPHPEVPQSLARLRDKGLRLATLTNSPPWIIQDQLTHAGLTHYFEQILSVHEIQRFKPDLETYRYAARQLNVPTDAILMVAAHDWDIAGAIKAGCRTVFIARPGMIIGALQQQPDLLGSDLLSVVDQITALGRYHGHFVDWWMLLSQ